MEQKTKLFINMILIPFIIGLLVNYVYGIMTEKNHSNANKSGSDVEVNIDIDFNINQIH